MSTNWLFRKSSVRLVPVPMADSTSEDEQLTKFNEYATRSGRKVNGEGFGAFAGGPQPGLSEVNKDTKPILSSDWQSEAASFAVACWRNGPSFLGGVGQARLNQITGCGNYVVESGRETLSREGPGYFTVIESCALLVSHFGDSQRQAAGLGAFGHRVRRLTGCIGRERLP